MSPDEREHAALLRQDRLDRLVQMATELAERERQAPGSMPDLAAEALHASVTSWAALLRLDVRP
jgi:hypothetical protein